MLLTLSSSECATLSCNGLRDDPSKRFVNRCLMGLSSTVVTGSFTTFVVSVDTVSIVDALGEVDSRLSSTVVTGSFTTVVSVDPVSVVDALEETLVFTVATFSSSTSLLAVNGAFRCFEEIFRNLSNCF